MPELTEDLDRITVWGYAENHDGYDFIATMKTILQIQEIRMREDYNLKEIYVINMKYCRLADCQQVTFPLLRKFEACAMVSS